MENDISEGILTGVKVLDLTRMLSGPYCTMMLADHGAEVIKIESELGDSSRANGPYRDDDPEKDWAGYFVSLNRSKKSVQLDLKTKSGKDNFRKLVTQADVVVENFRPGVMERLELNYEEFNNLYLFPDHHVFVPQQFKSGRLVSSNSIINFDSDFIYLNENISETQFIYLKVVLLVFNMISEKKVFNHIDVKAARSLSNSPDEKLRKKINL